MDSNLDLSIGFKGQLKLNAQVVPLQEGYLKLGGLVSTSQTGGLKFGVVASVDPDEPDVYTAGATSGNVVRGISVFDDSIAQNAPGHPNSYLAGMPCAVLNHGFCYIGGWTKTASTTSESTTTVVAIDPALGCKVIFNNTTGAIEFLAASGSAPTGWTVLTNAEVRDVDPDNGALIYIN